MKEIWGKGIDEACIAIENLVLTPQRIALLSPDKKPTIKITLPNGLTLLKFRSSLEEYNNLKPVDGGSVVINLVGKCSINTFRNSYEPQIFINDYEIVNQISYCF